MASIDELVTSAIRMLKGPINRIKDSQIDNELLEQLIAFSQNNEELRPRENMGANTHHANLYQITTYLLGRNEVYDHNTKTRRPIQSPEDVSLLRYSNIEKVLKANRPNRKILDLYRRLAASKYTWKPIINALLAFEPIRTHLGGNEEKSIAELQREEKKRLASVSFEENSREILRYVLGEKPIISAQSGEPETTEPGKPETLRLFINENILYQPNGSFLNDELRLLLKRVQGREERTDGYVRKDEFFTKLFNLPEVQEFFGCTPSYSRYVRRSEAPAISKNPPPLEKVFEDPNEARIWQSYLNGKPGSESVLALRYLYTIAIPYARQLFAEYKTALQNMYSDPEELGRVANFVIIERIRSYEPLTGIKFTDFAWGRIEGALFDEVQRLLTKQTRNSAFVEATIYAISKGHRRKRNPFAIE